MSYSSHSQLHHPHTFAVECQVFTSHDAVQSEQLNPKMSTSMNYKRVNRKPETSKNFRGRTTDPNLPAAFPVRRRIPHSPKRACVRTYQYETSELVFLEMVSQNVSSIEYSDVGEYCKKNLTSFRPTFDRTGKCRTACQQNTLLRTTHATCTYIRLKQHENL
jgi:hypothetical protein